MGIRIKRLKRSFWTKMAGRIYPNIAKKYRVIITDGWEGSPIILCCDSLEEAKRLFGKNGLADEKEDFIVEFV